jgi:hypothetical protein
VGKIYGWITRNIKTDKKFVYRLVQTRRNKFEEMNKITDDYRRVRRKGIDVFDGKVINGRDTTRARKNPQIYRRRLRNWQVTFGNKIWGSVARR